MAVRRLLRRLRASWVRTGQRTRLTAALRPVLATVGPLALDVGGGREAPHDDAWPASTRRIRVDISPTHVPDVVADATFLPVRSDTVDAVVMVELLEHTSEPALILAEAGRVLKDGGLLVGSVPFVAPVHGDPRDYFRFSAEGLRHLMRDFSEVRIRALGNHYSAAWALIAQRSKTLRILNPIVRNLGSKPDPRCPQGYLFTARARSTSST